MAKMKIIIDDEPVFPNMGGGYKLACCDCGLVHDVEFHVVEILQRFPDGSFEYSDPLDNKKYQVMFRAKRNNRSTANMRRKKK